MILDHGEIKFMGPTEEALSFYNSFYKKQDNKNPIHSVTKDKPLQKGEMNKKNEKRQEIEKEELIIKLEARIAELEQRLEFGSNVSIPPSRKSLTPALDKVG